jgi:tetratricopeptide (TPR) repeat protein
MSTAESHLEEARALQQAGDPDRAERAYLRALRIQPDHPQTLAALAGLYVESGQPARAVPLLQRALAGNPLWCDGYVALGIAHWQCGAMDEAEAALRKATRMRPGMVQAHFRLGELLTVIGKPEEAKACYQRTLKLDPGHAEARARVEAVAPGEQTAPATASVRDEQRARAHFSLGMRMQMMGRLEQAAASYLSAVEAWPDHIEAFEHLAWVRFAQGRYGEAAAAYGRLTELRPGSAAAFAGLGSSLLGTGEAARALTALRRAVEIEPGQPQAHAALGPVLARLGRLEEAIEAARHAVTLQPSGADAHFALALLLLQRGDYEEGWREYEWRKRTRHYTPPKVEGREWNGSPLNGETLLVTAEQGYGDSIQFARYLSVLKERGAGRVVLGCYSSLVRLLSGCTGCDAVVRLSDTTGELEPVDFDLHVTLLSLPFLLGTTLQTVPSRTPYIAVEAELLANWRRRLEDFDGLKVGLRWTGGTRLSGGARSCSRRDLAPLASVPNVRFCSLQAGPGVTPEPEVPDGLQPIDFTQDLVPFYDMAALMASLDLVITVDTAIAHLAGALGVPVWIALENAAEWRWMHDRVDSPWYPTARLFRQPRPGDWESVFTAMAHALASQPSGGAR